MNEAAPRPERENPPSERIFNVDAMSDEQIVVMYRGLAAVAVPETGEHDIDESDLGIRYGAEIADPLWGQLSAEVRDMAMRDPQRLKGLAQRCMASSREVDREFVAEIVPGLLDHDYEFTRDTLITIATSSQSLRSPVFADASQTARDRVAELMRDRLSPDQVLDFQVRAPGWSLRPAPPEES